MTDLTVKPVAAARTRLVLEGPIVSTLLRLAVKAFYSLVNWGARQKIPEDAGDFRLL